MKISTCLHSQSQNEVIDMTGISDIQKDFSNHIKKFKLYPIMAEEVTGSNDEVVTMCIHHVVSEKDIHEVFS